MIIISDNASVKKKSQQAILNYISVNFQKMDVNNQNEKSSAETAPSANRTPKEQRPKNTAGSTSSARGSNGGPQTRKTLASTNSATKPGNAANPSSNPKTTCTPTNNTETRNNKSRTPPSIEATTNPQKKLMMEGITSSNIETTLPTIKTSNTVPSSNSDTLTTRHNNEATATRHNQQSSRHNEDTSTTRNNDEVTTPRRNQQMLEGNENTATPRGNIEGTTTNGSASAAPIIVENPMEEEGMETDETLDDLGPELVKMGRILAKEITESLSNALIPLQNDIIQLRADTARLAQSKNKVEELKSENENLHARVCKLELNNRLLKRKLRKLEDRLLDNNLLFSRIKEEDGETELSRYQIILEIISTTFMGPDYQMQLNQAKQIRLDKLVHKGRYAPNRTQPISVTFSHHCDAQDILANKRYLPAHPRLSITCKLFVFFLLCF